MTYKSLSVIIPAYNEELNIELAIKEVHSFLMEKKYDYELIIINDGSTDKTDYLIQGYKCKIIYIRSEVNKGKASQPNPPATIF
jgi:glycosyltransferase involved in cell wall biosynthesis